MYKHEIQKQLSEGAKARRLAWPKSAFVVNHNHEGIAPGLNDEANKALGVRKDADITVSDDLLVYKEGTTQVILGYKLTVGDEKAQDWEVVG